MPTVSLKKVGLIVLMIVVLLHLGQILDAIGKVVHWFGERLEYMEDFPPGAQAAIAFCSVLLLVVIIFKLMNRKF